MKNTHPGLLPHNFIKRSDKGFLTIELLLALFVFTISMTGVITVASGGQTMGLDVGLTEGGIGNALSAIQESTQAASVLAGFNALDDSFTIAATPGDYSESQEVDFVNPCLKELTQNTGWDTEYNRSLSVGLATYIPSFDLVALLGDECDDPFPPSPEWDAPSAHAISDPIFQGNPASGLDVVRRVGNERYALVATWKNPSPNGENTLWMVDVTDLDVDPLSFSAVETDTDLLAVDAHENYAYAAGATSSSATLSPFTLQTPLMVFDISDPMNISFLAMGALNKADQGDGRSVAYNNGRAYVGTQYLACPPSCASDQNHEFHIFDVSNPAVPVWEASINVERDVNDIVVRDGIAYLATGPGGNNTVVKVYDVDPNSDDYLDLLDEYAAPSAQEATALYLLGDYLFVGRDRPNGSGTTNTLFIVLDVSDPTSISVTDSTNLNIAKGTAVSGIHVKGDIAFIVTGDLNGNQQSGNVGDGPFIMYDVRDKSDIKLIVPCISLNWSEKSTGMDMVDDAIFVSNESNDALQVIEPTPACAQ